ncbi:MAG: hypothetical protein K2G01_06685 [Paramuribaculum sp.]|nr:hypothetical protein [Paramuribaculum sp.]
MFEKLLLSIAALSAATTVSAASEQADTSAATQPSTYAKPASRFQVGGYGEAVYSYNFFSDAWNRYKTPETIASTKNDRHGRVDLPHVVIFLGYDFGKGWSMGTEIEFEHGGTESAVEMEDDEGGEYESEVERGGEVALEQFWLQKRFTNALNLRVGHMIVPVGGTNAHHMPTEFFGVYRPAGDNTIIPCTWHETGISVFGTAGDWSYEAMLVPGLDSDRFGREGWAADAAGSPYEFKIANAMAGAFRIDNRSVKGLRLSVSGYAGNTFSNTLSHPNQTWDDVKGTLSIGAFDFAYSGHGVIARGGVIYGHLTNSDQITIYNKKLRADSPSPKTNVASDAISAGVEIGYDIFNGMNARSTAGQRFYIFSRWDYYDSMFKTAGGVLKYDWCGRNRIAAGVNWYPIKQVVVKGEYSIGLMRSPFNNEPSVSVGVAYAGFFTR